MDIRDFISYALKPKKDAYVSTTQLKKVLNFCDGIGLKVACRGGIKANEIVEHLNELGYPCDRKRIDIFGYKTSVGNAVGVFCGIKLRKSFIEEYKL